MVQTPALTEVPIPEPTDTVTLKPTGTVTPIPTWSMALTPAQIVAPTSTATVTPTSTTAPPASTPTATVTPTPVASDLYKLKIAKWTTLPVTFYVNPDGSGLDGYMVARECSAALATWDDAVGVSLVMDGGRTATAQGQNGRNEVYWTPLSTTGVVAQTTVYWTTSGTILEADIKMNSNAPWGIDEDGEGISYCLTDRHDIRNIVTHEAGHVFGLGDLYESSAADLTMYGYSTRGQTKKISLGYGDVLGIRTLYET